MNVDDIYTPIEDIRKEIKKRWEDNELEKKVNDFLDNDIPDFLIDKPKALLMRQIQSPNLEFVRFIKMVNNNNLDFALPEYLDDVYIPENMVKYYLGKMYFDLGMGKNGGKKISNYTLINIAKSKGKKIKDIETNFGNKLVDFHHNILYSEFPETIGKTKDMTKWLNKNGRFPAFYYKLIVLALRNCIIFDSFILNDEEKYMTKNIVLPAVKEIKQKFGVKPLIVRLLPKETENDPHSCYYSGNIKKYIKNEF